MPKCGSQCWMCDLPVRFDTYKGCTHGCKYCFVQRKSSLEVGIDENPKKLIDFINGKRDIRTAWVDWNIPIHFGGMSDPFQPCEKKYKKTLEALQILADTGYPCVISTKGRLCIEEPYISIIKRANIVMQVSCVCDKYDKLEKGAPPFEERLNIIRVLSQNARRVIVRVQPYVPDVYKDVKANIKRFAESGAHGVVFEGMKFVNKKDGLVRVGGGYGYPIRKVKT